MRWTTLPNKRQSCTIDLHFKQQELSTAGTKGASCVDSGEDGMLCASGVQALVLVGIQQTSKVIERLNQTAQVLEIRDCSSTNLQAYI